MTALLISMFLLIVGMAFLYFMERDSYLQLMADRQARSVYLARAGVEYFCFCHELLPASPDINGAVRPLTAGATQTISFNANEVVNVTVTASGAGCSATGCILDDTGKVIARSTMVVPESTHNPATPPARYPYLPPEGISDAQLQ